MKHSTESPPEHRVQLVTCQKFIMYIMLNIRKTDPPPVRLRPMRQPVQIDAPTPRCYNARLCFQP
jgi:hypothetical protein